MIGQIINGNSGGAYFRRATAPEVNYTQNRWFMRARSQIRRVKRILTTTAQVRYTVLSLYRFDALSWLKIIRAGWNDPLATHDLEQRVRTVLPSPPARARARALVSQTNASYLSINTVQNRRFVERGSGDQCHRYVYCILDRRKAPSFSARHLFTNIENKSC